MQNIYKVIVERSPDYWSAWFDGFPQFERRGECYDDAFRQLLELFGEEFFDLEQIAVIGDSIREGHLEVMVPLRWSQRIPSPSTN
jgi:hypothetical protein